MDFNLRKIVQLFTYYLIPLYLLFSVLFSFYSNDRGFEHMVIEYGENAFNLILIILFIKPLSVIFSKIVFFKKLLLYRREFGVLAFWFAVFHGVSLIFYLELIDFSSFFSSYLFYEKLYILGFLGFIGMIVLGFTSNKISVMKFGKNWKKIQLIAYPTFVFACFHRAEAENEIGPFIILGLYIILKIIEYVIRKKGVKK